MIAIVNYGIEKNYPLTNLLSEIEIAFKVTNTESEILRADKIILPSTRSISSAIRQLHLLNLLLCFAYVTNRGWEFQTGCT